MTTLTLDAADTATLAAGGSVTISVTGTAPVVTPVVTPVTPPVTPPVVAPVVSLKVVIAQDGQTPLWPQNYSYGCTSSSVAGGDGNANCIEVTGTSSWPGYQPSNNNGQVTDFSACETLTVSVKSPSAGLPYTMQFLMVGDVVVDGPGGGTSFAFASTKAGVWETFTVPASVVMTSVTKGDVRKQIYKGAIQCHVAGNVTFYVDNWGGF